MTALTQAGLVDQWEKMTNILYPGVWKNNTSTIRLFLVVKHVRQSQSSSFRHSAQDHRGCHTRVITYIMTNCLNTQIFGKESHMRRIRHIVRECQISGRELPKILSIHYKNVETTTAVPPISNRLLSGRDASSRQMLGQSPKLFWWYINICREILEESHRFPKSILLHKEPELVKIKSD